MATITKPELLELLSIELMTNHGKKFSKENLQAVLTAFETTISKQLADGNDVRLVGFCHFKTKDVPARIYRNPQNGQEISKPATRVPTFVAGKIVKDTIQNKL